MMNEPAKEIAKEIRNPLDGEIRGRSKAVNRSCSLVFREGCFAGLLDALNWIRMHQECLKSFRINNAKGVIAFLSCAAENLDYFMNAGDQTEFLVTKKGKTLFFERKP